jgi:predicted nucleic acid-binding Zn ribbon protein
MERAGRFLAKLKLSDPISGDELACAAWKAVVGERLAQHARATTLVRGKLIVETEDRIWQQQLFFLRSQILAKIDQVLGNGIVNDLEFRIATSRRPPQMATALDAKAPSLDEAESIADAALRVVYKNARKKAVG